MLQSFFNHVIVAGQRLTVARVLFPCSGLLLFFKFFAISFCFYGAKCSPTERHKSDDLFQT